MAMFNCYVSSPEGTCYSFGEKTSCLNQRYTTQIRLESPYLVSHCPTCLPGAMWVADGVLYGFGEYVWVAKPPDKFYDRFRPKVWIYMKFTTKSEDLPSGKLTELWKI